VGCDGASGRTVTVSRMMMTETRARRVTYQGDPALARALALMLEEEGARVRLRRPQATDEQRELASMLQNVASGLLVWGTAEAITTAVNKFRQRFPGAGGSVTIEGDHGGDD
jgi:hypothetical protein